MEKMMKGAVALFLAGGLATPVLAATTTSTANQNSTNQDQMSSPKLTNMREQITNDLTKAGFTDIKVMPESFMIHAKDSKGNPAIMVINPDSFTEVTEVATPKSPTASNPGTASGQKVLSGANANGDATPPAKQ